MKVKLTVYQGKSYNIAKKNVWALFRNKQIQLYKLHASYGLEVDVKIEYLFVPKGTKFTGLGKLGLIGEKASHFLL